MAEKKVLYRIEVTEHHIMKARGGAQNSNHCAIAYAIAQETGGKHIRVTDKRISWTCPDTGRRNHFQSTGESSRFVHKWDAWATGKRKTPPSGFVLLITEDDLLEVREKPVLKPERIIKPTKAKVVKKRKVTKAVAKPRSYREIPEYVIDRS